MGRIRAIVFDMGDVFFDATPWRRAIVGRLQTLGVSIEYAEFCRRWEEQLVDVYLGKCEYWGRFEGFMKEMGLRGAVVEEAVGFARQTAAEVEVRTLFEGVAETLAGLKERGLKLGVLSDTESREARVRQRLAAMGIEAYFDAVVTSVDIGWVKPMPEAYAAILARLGTTADETLFVGHDEEELAGARRCGLSAVAFNAEPGANCDYRIQGFHELLALIGP